MQQAGQGGYYANMAQAWAVSICYREFPEETLPFLKENSLNDFTHNKAIQKITESLKVPEEKKETYAEKNVSAAALSEDNAKAGEPELQLNFWDLSDKVAGFPGADLSVSKDDAGNCYDADDNTYPIVVTNIVSENTNIKIMVSLSCTKCPEVVMAAQRIASLNKNVQAEMFDLRHYPDIKDKYSIMSVPCIIINDSKILFGKKSMEEILEEL